MRKLLSSLIVLMCAVPLLAQTNVLGIQGKATYSAASTFTPAATPTDLLTITGSATKIIRVQAITLATTNTAAGSQQFVVVKRSAANTGGTFVAQTAVPWDADSPTATAVIGHYTANAAGLGAGVTMGVFRVASPAAIPASFAGVVDDAGMDLVRQGSLLTQPITLRGVLQIVAVNFAGAALVAGQTHAYTVVWTEE